jgi:hypothetical protein
MVEKCANSECSASFHNLREGRVFVIEVQDDSRPDRGRSRQLRYLWLCNACCRTMTVVAEKGQGIKVASHRCILLGESSATRPKPERSV